MHSNQRPPVAHKKGIGVLQSSKTHKLIENEQSSGLRSVRSSSQSRGISISRSSGINIDKIYENKNFPPAQSKKQNFDKTLASCKSLKLISLHSQATNNNPKESQLKTQSQLKGESYAGTKLQANNQIRSSSPISKLNFVPINSKIDLNERQNKLLNF